MDSQLDEFKQFVRKYPGLKYDVRNGKATWQSIYEEWYLYGEEDSQWEKYKEIPTESSTSNTYSVLFADCKCFLLSTNLT